MDMTSQPLFALTRVCSRRLFCAAAFLVVIGHAVPALRAAPTHRDVFLIAGQSNADGRGHKAELIGELAAHAEKAPAALIHYTNTAYAHKDKKHYKKWMPLEPGYSVAPGYRGRLPSHSFGVEIGAARVLTHGEKSAYPHPAFIKVTRGGTALCVPGTDWYPAPLDSNEAGPLYKALITSTRLALADLRAAGDTYTIHALFWHQGESDSDRAEAYGKCLTALTESVRRDLDLPNLRFVIGELAHTKSRALRDAQWQVARSMQNVGFISSCGLPTGDGTHFTTPAMMAFGERLGHALRPDHQPRGVDAYLSPCPGTGCRCASDVPALIPGAPKRKSAASHAKSGRKR
jgi:iduronate 2-sulfatase